mgnify:CR=1 FL=1
MNANCKVPAWKDRNGKVHLNHEEFVHAELRAIFIDFPEAGHITDTIASNRAEIVELLKERKPRTPKAAPTTAQLL